MSLGMKFKWGVAGVGRGREALEGFGRLWEGSAVGAGAGIGEVLHYLEPEYREQKTGSQVGRPSMKACFGHPREPLCGY